MSGAGEVKLQYAALPYRIAQEDQLNILLITSRGTGRWVLPKGWPDGDETGPQAATREALEEAGVLGRIEPAHALGFYHYQKGLKDGSAVTCRVTVFGLKVENFAGEFREKGRRALRWCSPTHAAEIVDEPELAHLLRCFAEATMPGGVGQNRRQAETPQNNVELGGEQR